MVALDERLEGLKSQQRVGWRSVPEDPTTLPGHHATLLWEQLRELARTEDTAKRPEDFRRLLADSERTATQLRETLRTSPADGAKLDGALKRTTRSCAACHKTYRNEKP
jgi:cytochrome c556